MKRPGRAASRKSLTNAFRPMLNLQASGTDLELSVLEILGGLQRSQAQILQIENGVSRLK
jgi:hypothetical protein